MVVMLFVRIFDILIFINRCGIVSVVCIYGFYIGYVGIG